jgi:CRISPR-associated protein Csb3
MSKPEPIRVNVDLTNPGQFFACCGLLELADRLWPGAAGWFASPEEFILSTGGRARSVEPLCRKVVECSLSPLLATNELDQLNQLNQRKAELKKASKSLPKAEETKRKLLSKKRIASGFQLGSPINMRVDWWLIESCDGDHLKTWAGPQAIAGIADAIKAALLVVHENKILDVEKAVFRESDGNAVAPLSFDAGRVGTAQDIGYSPDKVGQTITCCVWTEFLTLLALQRFALQPDSNGFFTYHVWRDPLEVCVAAVAARGRFPQMIACEGTFRLAARDSGNRYKAFQQATLTEWRSQ